VIGRWLINLLLLALMFLLVSLIQRDITRARTPPILSDLIASDLLLIEIVREGEPTMKLGQSLQGWRLEAPMQMDADQDRVDSLIAILNTPVHRSIPQAAADLDQLGLASPRIRLRLNTLELAFGGIDPVGHFRYVASEGLVHLIDDRFHHLLIAPPLDYVSRQLLPRGLTPVFGRINGVPLAADALAGLTTVSAERIEPVTGDPGGKTFGSTQDTPVELKSADGTALHFLVSADRRRWRLEMPRPTPAPESRAGTPPALLYVLATAPLLTEDPSAIDPTPESVRNAVMGDSEMPASDPNAALDSLSVDTADPFAPPPDPDAILSGDVPLGPPPEVRLTPDGEAPVEVRPASKLHGEPDKAAPTGFGEDPFAPDPASGINEAPVSRPRPD
jgi:hypothetical protein